MAKRRTHQSRKGIPNYRREGKPGKDQILTNQHGVSFTYAEKKEYESLVAKVNYRRKKQIKRYQDLPLFSSGSPTGQTVGQLQSLGKVNDFIIHKRSKSLQHIKDRETFDYRMNQMKSIVNHEDHTDLKGITHAGEDYVTYRSRVYRDNMLSAMIEVFGDDAEDIIDHIYDNMSLDEFVKVATQNSDEFDFYYIYHEEVPNKINQIRSIIGLPIP